MVSVVGFEPTAYGFQNRRATGLRYTLVSSWMAERVGIEPMGWKASATPLSRRAKATSLGSRS
jgi:hypothetical protein